MCFPSFQTRSFLGLLLCCVLACSNKLDTSYSVQLLNFDAHPVISFIDGTTQFQQSFNPSWVPPSPGTNGVSGLLVRSQNCSATPGGDCIHCSGTGPLASSLTFSRMLSNGTIPKFEIITEDSVVFGPEPNNALEVQGTEDPRIAFDAESGTYYLFYTCYGKDESGENSVLLCLATTSNPTSSSHWQRHGAVFPGAQGSKSAALLLRQSPPHYLLWGAGEVRVAKSSDPLVWPDQGDLIITPGDKGRFDDTGVESGPPPLQLSTGDYFFIYNAWSQDGHYHSGWIILNQDDPSQVIQRSDNPFLEPIEPWERGILPYTCNVDNVVFVEAARITDQPDVFQVFFGGADAVVGCAVIQVVITK